MGMRVCGQELTACEGVSAMVDPYKIVQNELRDRQVCVLQNFAEPSYESQATTHKRMSDSVFSERPNHVAGDS